MSPVTIEHLPAEVLSKIFAHCIPDPRKDDTGGRSTLEILEGVCDAWKAITSFTPELWTIISVKFHAGSRKPDVEQAFQSTKTFLQRSGVLPLRISLIDRDRSPGLDCARLIRLLVEHSERWRYVHFDMPLKWHRIICRSRVRNRLPSLEALSLLVSGNSQSNYPCTVYGAAPKLTAVRISSTFILGSSALPWDQLMEWKGILSASGFLQLLRVCTRLRSCSVPSVTRHYGIPSLAMVKNDSLSRLKFELCLELEAFLPYISLPALTNLTIEDGTRGDNILPSSCLDGLLQRAHLLRYLRVGQWSSAISINLIGLAALTPELVYLDLEVTTSLATQCLTSDLLLGLTVIPGEVVILPKLKHYKCSGFIFFSDSSLYRFIVSRWRGSEQEAKGSGHMSLESVWIQYDRRARQVVKVDRAADGQESIRGLKEKGFDISILREGQTIL